ncbi:MAG TPA: hypothetical protein ENN39_03865 [Desulfonatronum sp.]|nr:hypothetical protein [Desulfonatronum sp.]
MRQHQEEHNKGKNVSDLNACKQWLNEVNWDMIHEDAVTMFLEWGNNNWHDAMRLPVRGSDDYSLYFVVDTWAEPKVVLMKMSNYGSTTLCEKRLPHDLAQRYLQSIGGLRGIHELNTEVKEWLTAELEK